MGSSGTTWRTGYFGTSVLSPFFAPTSGTLSSAGLLRGTNNSTLIAARDAGNTANITFGTNTSDQLVGSHAIVAPSFTSNSTAAGSITLSEPSGTGSDGVTLSAPASVTTSYTMTYPAAQGLNKQVLVNDGAGAMAWGGVTSLCAPQTPAADTLTASVISTTETAFATTCTIPASFLITNRALEACVTYKATTSGSPPNIITRVRLGGIGGTIVSASASGTPPTNLTDIVGTACWQHYGTAAAGASANVVSGAGNMASTGTSILGARNATAQPVAVATNASQDWALTLEYSANTAGNSVTLLGLTMKVIQ